MPSDRFRVLSTPAALRREDGFAMITVMIVSSIMMLFTLGMLATGLHLTDATVRDRRWNTALQVAEAGLDLSVYAIGQDDTYPGTGTGVVQVPGGEVEVAVDRPANGEVVVYATAWVPSRAAPNALSRRIRVAFAPEDVFSFALFSATGLYVRSGTGDVVGDVFANEGVEVDNTSTVHGSVISATEGVKLGNQATVTGDVHSGGPAGVVVANSAQVLGSAFAQATSCSGTPAVDTYGVTAIGAVHGDATAWGSISGNVMGSSTPSNCQLAVATRQLPTFKWDPSLYGDEVLYTSVQPFIDQLEASAGLASGTHRVWSDVCEADPGGADSVIDLDEITGGHVDVNDDFTLITNCRLDLSNSFTVSAPDEAVINIIVLNDSADPASVTIKNSFDVAPNDPAVLLFTPGLIEVKNSAESNGAVYAGAISIKNGLEITYDPRVERSLGFGDLKYDRVSWQECVVGTTGFDC